MTTVREALAVATGRLASAGIEGAARDARRLMAHALGVAADRVTLMAPDVMTDAQIAAFEAAVTRRVAREPVSHIVGTRAFYGRSFIVTPDVLDPRPETETLIAAALERPFASVLDLGLGSGAILLTLLAEQPLAKGLGVDISQAAIDVARRNAETLGLAARARFSQGDWFAPVDGKFDLVVSNPPYIAASEMDSLSPELGYEPRVALTDEADGLDAYRTIAARVREYLAPRGRVIVETGPTQGRAVADLFLDAGLKGVRVLGDLDGRDRVVIGQAPNPHPRNAGR